jgi:DNA-3-methyladenine glycosylase
LLGKYLVIKRGTKEAVYMITEIEAYDWQEDQACHARFGQTARNAPMFGLPGCWYVYLVYGMYRMLNIVTGPGNHPSAILIRWVEGIKGPGKVTKTLKIDKKYNDKPASKKTWLRIEDRWIMAKSYTTTKRIWIAYAGEWAHKNRRFLMSV